MAIASPEKLNFDHRTQHDRSIMSGPIADLANLNIVELKIGLSLIYGIPE